MRFFYHASNDNLVHEISYAWRDGPVEKAGARMWCGLIVAHGDGRAFVRSDPRPKADHCNLCSIRKRKNDAYRI